MPFRVPEIPALASALDDEAFADGEGGGAEVARELIRQGNLLVAREHMVFRWLGRARAAGLEQGFGLTSAPPSWEAMVPVPPTGMPVPKKHGLTRLRMRIRAEVDDGRFVHVHLATSISPAPTETRAPTLVMEGTGAPAVYEVEGVACRRGGGESIALFMRAQLDPDNDPLLDTGTFGTPASGTLNGYGERMTVVGAAWNATGGDQVHLGGHYMVTKDAAGAIRFGPAEIRATEPAVATTNILYFWPPAEDQRALTNALFEIRKLPLVRIYSIAIYAQDRTS